MSDTAAGSMVETGRPVVMAVTGAPGATELVRRGIEIANSVGAALIAVHVRPPSGNDPGADLEQIRVQLETSGASYREIVGNDPAARLIEFCTAEHASQLILGAANPSRWQQLVGRSFVAEVVRLAGSLDVHVVAHAGPRRHLRTARRRTRPIAGLAIERRVGGWVAAVIGVPVMIALLVIERRDINLSADLLILLLVVIGVAALGGRAPAVVAAIGASLMANWYLTPPYHRWEISRRESQVALIVFIATAIIVSSFVSSAARRDIEASRARAEAETLARLATTFGDVDPLGALVAHLRSTFSLDGVAVVQHVAGHWTTTASSGQAATTPGAGDVAEPLGPDTTLVLTGPRLSADDRRVLRAFALHLSATIERSALAETARRAANLEQANALRDALLQAVSHDLRTPLAGIKASVSSLRDPEIEWAHDDREEFLATIESETDRLTSLVSNLLDLSRLQAGELLVNLTPVSIEEVVPAAILSLGPPGRGVHLDLPESTDDLAADRALLERVMANLVANAIKYSPPDRPVTVTTASADGFCDLQVIDHGPGIPASQRSVARLPFHRLHDREVPPGVSVNVGVGLGLAIADGFTRAQHGELILSETPGGGLTAIVRLPVWPR
jgi:two-component system, OmpR family, sensor histidine kinase KdpD